MFKRLSAIILFFLPCIVSAKGDTYLLFNHGFGGHSKNGNYYQEKVFSKNMKLVAPEYEHSPRFPGNKGRVNACHASLGGKNEVAINQNAHKKIIKKDKKAKIIEFGVSNGAFVASKSKKNKHVKGLILESPAAHCKHITDLKVNQFGLNWFPGAKTVAHYIFLKLFMGKYNPWGNQPVDCVKHISKDMPVMIHYVEGDGLVPDYSAVQLAESFKKSGHKYVYVSGFQGTDHGMVLSPWMKRHNIKKYKQLNHAFMKKCGVGCYNETIARAGEKALHACEMNLDDITALKKTLQQKDGMRYLGRNFVTFGGFLAGAYYLWNKCSNMHVNKQQVFD